MHAARSLTCLLTAGVFVLSGFPVGVRASDETKPKTFPEKVTELFKGDWTEFHIASALLTDYGRAHMTGVVLSRAAPGKPITCRSTHEKPGNNKPVDDALLKSLEEHLLKTATAVHASVTPLEHLHRLTPEQQRKAIQDGLEVGPTDFEGLVVWAETPKGRIVLGDADADHGRACDPLEEFLEKHFGSKGLDVENSEIKEKLGHDPFEKL
ncbi:hypothetical protein DES53_101813 [Roseimicrobium gellanilyticum]|uniref:Uncharacterized protein n=1 Tax=Roseimicrobium gellanilyticum TaxID=748857 RepID=A0A366HUP3_9BACT|nr:hypothetical protein [Roseimicrobium gellanilyticum]RBP48013.1 hypothetical protein DES53_101813 [Roseimicrobium gellanilyticum]